MMLPMAPTARPVGKPLQGKDRERMIQRKQVSPGDILMVNDDQYFSLHKLTDQELLKVLQDRGLITLDKN